MLEPEYDHSALRLPDYHFFTVIGATSCDVTELGRLKVAVHWVGAQLRPNRRTAEFLLRADCMPSKRRLRPE